MTESELAQLSRSTSRRAAIASGLGALVLMLAFGYAIYQLAGVEKKVDALNREIALKTSAVGQLQRESDGLKQELGKYKTLSLKLNQAVELVWSRQYAEALKALDEVLSLDKENASALYWKSLCLYRLEKYDEAVIAASLAIGIDGDFFDPYVPLVFALNKRGRQAEALDRLAYALNLRIDNFNQLLWRQTDVNELLQIPAFKDLIEHHESTLKMIQTRLKELGYYDGKADALVGSQTLTAISRFSADQGITRPLPVSEMLELLKQAKK
jgi:tetratricopeptide (TPR) repeat protein